MNPVQFEGMRNDAVLSCPKGVQLLPVAGEMKTVSDSLDFLKLELEREEDPAALEKLAEGAWNRVFFHP